MLGRLARDSPFSFAALDSEVCVCVCVFCVYVCVGACVYVGVCGYVFVSVACPNKYPKLQLYGDADAFEGLSAYPTPPLQTSFHCILASRPCDD